MRITIAALSNHSRAAFRLRANFPTLARPWTGFIARSGFICRALSGLFAFIAFVGTFVGFGVFGHIQLFRAAQDHLLNIAILIFIQQRCDRWPGFRFFLFDRLVRGFLQRLSGGRAGQFFRNMRRCIRDRIVTREMRRLVKLLDDRRG